MKNKRGLLESVFEGCLWKGRLITVLAVVFGMIGSISLFFVASYDIILITKKTFLFFIGSYRPSNFHELLIGKIIGAVDLYLIAVVMLIFSFGIYELFISAIDDAEDSEVGNKILEIHSLDELKDKLGKVVIMVLVIGFFKRVMNMNYSTPLEMLSLAGSILMLALALYITHKHPLKGQLRK